MIGLLLILAAAQTAGPAKLPPPMVITEAPPPVVDKPSPAAQKSTLIGCMFIERSSTQAKPVWRGFGIYLPAGVVKGPVSASMIDDPRGLLGSAGFEKVQAGPDWIQLSGRNSLLLNDTGGGIFSADLQTQSGWKPQKPGTCQIGEFDSRENAFAFFDGLLRDMNGPGERGQ